MSAKIRTNFHWCSIHPYTLLLNHHWIKNLRSNIITLGLRTLWMLVGDANPKNSYKNIVLKKHCFFTSDIPKCVVLIELYPLRIIVLFTKQSNKTRLLGPTKSQPLYTKSNLVAYLCVAPSEIGRYISHYRKAWNLT